MFGLPGFCEMVCSFHHEGKFSPRLSRVTVVKEDKYGLDYLVFCHQCNPCPSISTCPSGALNRTKRGVIYVNGDACIGCGNCVNACIFDAIKPDENAKPLVCDLCKGKPVCVEKCPTEALSFVETEEFYRHEEAFKNLLERWGIAD